MLWSSFEKTFWLLAFSLSGAPEEDEGNSASSSGHIQDCSAVSAFSAALDEPVPFTIAGLSISMWM